MKNIFKLRPILIVSGILIPSFLVGALAFLIYRSQQQLNEAAHRVTHTVDVQHHIQSLGLDLADAETGQRGYLLITNEGCLNTYQSGIQNAFIESNILRTLTADNPVQQMNLNQVGPAITDKLSVLAQAIWLQQQGRREAALALIETGRGQKDTEAIQQTLARMDAEERRLLVLRQEELARQTSVNTLLAMSLVGLTVVFSGIICLLLYRLRKSEAWVTVCAWSKTIEHQGEWLTFEEYLQRRFNFNISHGMSPKGPKQFFERKQSSDKGPAPKP